jgi:hypothetical protein
MPGVAGEVLYPKAQVNSGLARVVDRTGEHGRGLFCPSISTERGSGQRFRTPPLFGIPLLFFGDVERSIVAPPRHELARELVS